MMSLKTLAEQVLSQTIFLDTGRTPVRQSIQQLIDHAEHFQAGEIATYIRDHAERWPVLGDEYSGMVEMMIGLHPDRANRIPEQAARAVYYWIEYRDLERIGNQEYRDRLQTCWDVLRQPDQEVATG
ncbi:MAG TPA: hypothetical protein PLY86_16745 [bacterium]|nr:hypothetical protein [bacterium]